MAGVRGSSKPVKPVQPMIGKNFQVKILPKNKHPPGVFDTRPPWNPDVLIRSTSNRYEKRTECTIKTVEVPCPDYTCFEVSRYNLTGDQAIPDGEMLLLQKNYKVAPWCNPKIHTKQVKHYIEVCNGKTREFDVEMPSNYRTVYLDKNAMTNVQFQGQNQAQNANVYVPLDHSQDREKRVFYESSQAKVYGEKRNAGLSKA